MRHKLVLLIVTLGLLVVGSGVASATKDTCTPSAGWIDHGNGKRTADGQIIYDSPYQAGVGFRCGPLSEQQLAAQNAINRARDPLLHTICEARPVPGHEAELAAMQAQAGLNCADPKYAKPPTPRANTHPRAELPALQAPPADFLAADFDGKAVFTRF